MKKFKILFILILTVLMTLSLSSCLTAITATFVQEQRQEAARMEAELVEEPTMTVTENEEGMYETNLVFSLKNNGDEDCRVWWWTVSFYDEGGYLIGSFRIYESSRYYVDFPERVLKKGTTTQIELGIFEMPYRPASVRVWDIGLFKEDIGAFIE